MSHLHGFFHLFYARPQFLPSVLAKPALGAPEMAGFAGLSAGIPLE
jgi:hypothetical protein